MTSWRFGSSLAVILLLAVTTAAAHLSPWDEWRLGYTNFEIGEQTRTRGDYTASLEAFEKSKRHYQAVKKARPDWNQKVIRERLEACDKQINELRRLLGDKAPAPASPQEKDGAKPSTAERVATSPAGARHADSAEEQLRRVRRELAEATTELDELRRERANRRNSETEIANLIRDQRIAREKYALLEKSYRKLQEDLKKPESSLQELRKQLLEKHDRLTDAEKTIRLLEERLRREEQNMATSNREKIQLRKQLQQLEETRQRIQAEADGIRTELGSAQERGRKAEMRAAELEKSLSVAEARAADLAKSLRESEANRSSVANQASAAVAENSEELARLRAYADAADKRTKQFQQQCVDLRRECDEMLKKLQAAEQLRSSSEENFANVRAEAEKEHTRAESLADELTKVRELQRRQEAELTKVLAEIEPLKERLARRDSDDFKGMVEAQSALRKLEEEVAALKNREAENNVVLAEEKKLTASLRQKLEDVKQALLKARGRVKSSEQELEAVRGDAEKFRELAPRYQELERNFAALHRENQENRIKLAAASPREAELRRIKLRLVELDQLKSSLGREQRLTAELAADKKRLQEELAGLRELGTELAAARKQLENLKALQREVQELRRVNQDTVARLETMKKLEDELVTARKSLIESGAAQLELHEVKVAYAKVLNERNTAATEAARLRDELSEAASREKRSREILTEAVNEASRLRDELSKLESQEKRTREVSAAAESEASRLRSELSKLESREKHTREVSAAAESEASRLRDELAKLESREKRSSEASAIAEKGLAQTLEKTRQQLREAQDRVEKLEAVLPQLEQLRKLNDELMRARSFEAELIKARAALGELTRYKDELAGVTKLNEQLARDKAELEKELARRPRLPFQDQQEEHLKLVRAATREKPEDYVAEGILAESAGSIELAIWNYRKALWLEPAHGEASERLGLLLLKRGDYEEAARLLAAARAAAPNRVDLALAISRAYLGQKRFGNAQAVLEPLLKRYPENGELLTVAALAAADSGDAATAEKYLKLAIRFLPNSPEPRIEFSRLLIHQDAARLDEASSLYEKARLMGARPDTELEPILGPRLDKRREMESFLHSAMNEAFDSKDYSGAAWYCKQLLELNRRPAYFTPLLALARLLGGESGGARETLTFNSESAQGALVLALVELKDGDRQAFSAAVRRALSLNQGRPVIIDAEWRNLGFALDAARAANSAAGAELATAYRWETAR
jgi:DNA repair exonuclease SbcCD ATPase subunit